MKHEQIQEEILAEYREVFNRIDWYRVRDFMDTINKYQRIFCIGVGREGLVTKAFAMRLMHMGKEVHWIWDETTPAIKKGDLLIATSGDGAIGHINYVCEKAKENGAYIYVVTGSPSGITARQTADQVLFIPASVYRGTDPVVESMQPMGNLFEQSLFIIFDIMVMMMVEATPEITYETMELRHRNVE